jgi:hypothetical protein
MWDEERSGGCLINKTWSQNPKFKLSCDEGEYMIILKRKPLKNKN